MAKVYIIWDNSNIHYGGLNQVFPIKEPGQQKELYRTHFLNLLNLVVGNREIGQVYFVGSTPPESDSIWAYLRSVGTTLLIICFKITFCGSATFLKRVLLHFCQVMAQEYTKMKASLQI